MFFSATALRLAAALQAANIVTPETELGALQHLVESLGDPEAVSELNERYGIILSIGDYIIESRNEGGFWHNSAGWVLNPDAANGYPVGATTGEMALLIQNYAPDARFVLRAAANPNVMSYRAPAEAF
jgi:hypothetical protein